MWWQIRTRRGQANKPRYMTYRAQLNPKKDLEVFAAQGHEQLTTQGEANASKKFLTAKKGPEGGQHHNQHLHRRTLSYV